MNTSIELNRMHFFAYHGVSVQERRVGNDYEVSLRVRYPFEQAMMSDNLDDTLDLRPFMRWLLPRWPDRRRCSNMWRDASAALSPNVSRPLPAERCVWAKLTPPIAGEIGEAVVVVEW